MKRSVVIFSGGLDSTTLLYEWVRTGEREVSALTVNYGQRHACEIEHARRIARKLGVAHRIADLTGLKPLFGHNALTDTHCAIPRDAYDFKNMTQTIVPNRNMILLAVAGAWAASIKAEEVGYAAHAGDHTVYPDCRPEFAEAMDVALSRCDWNPLHLARPYVNLTKADIVKRGSRAGVDYADTWSCYEGGDIHCGICATCRERKQAFLDAGVPDPTAYRA